MGVAMLVSPTSLPSLAVTGNVTVGGNFRHQGASVGLFNHALGVQQGPYTLAGGFNAAMAALTAVAAAATAATNVTPFGYSTAAQADAIRAAVNALITDVTTLQANVNAIITGLQQTGIFS